MPRNFTLSNSIETDGPRAKDFLLSEKFKKIFKSWDCGKIPLHHLFKEIENSQIPMTAECKRLFEIEGPAGTLTFSKLIRSLGIDQDGLTKRSLLMANEKNQKDSPTDGLIKSYVMGSIPTGFFLNELFQITKTDFTIDGELQKEIRRHEADGRGTFQKFAQMIYRILKENELKKSLTISRQNSEEKGETGETGETAVTGKFSEYFGNKNQMENGQILKIPSLEAPFATAENQNDENFSYFQSSAFPGGSSNLEIEESPSVQFFQDVEDEFKFSKKKHFSDLSKTPKDFLQWKPGERHAKEYDDFKNAKSKNRKIFECSDKNLLVWDAQKKEAKNQNDLPNIINWNNEVLGADHRTLKSSGRRKMATNSGNYILKAPYGNDLAN